MQCLFWKIHQHILPPDYNSEMKVTVYNKLCQVFLSYLSILDVKRLLLLLLLPLASIPWSLFQSASMLCPLFFLPENINHITRYHGALKLHAIKPELLFWPDKSLWIISHWLVDTEHPKVTRLFYNLYMNTSAYIKLLHLN